MSNKQSSFGIFRLIPEIERSSEKLSSKFFLKENSIAFGISYRGARPGSVTVYEGAGNFITS